MRDINPQDPYGPSTRSIRNIPLTHKRHPPQGGGGSRSPRRPRSRRFILWGAGAVAACVIIGVLLSTVFAGAAVHVSARRVDVSPSGTLLAQLNAAGGGLAYLMVSVTRSATTTVPANGTQHVSRQASGLITIYNDYSSASQRLIANTRFEAPDGKIYRIRDSVVVPGKSDDTPGSVSVTVYADSPGVSYNRSGPTTFTIPGFKGDPRYSGFSAKSQGSITGGFVGSEPAVAAADLASAKSSLEKGLDTDVRAAVSNAIPAGYVAVPGTLTVTFGDVTQSDAGGGKAYVSQSATAAGAVMDAADLAAAIAKQTVSDYKGEAVALDPNSNLALVAATSSDPANGRLVLTVGGSATLVWQFDPDAVKQALLGKPKSEFQTVIESFIPAISCAAESPCDASVRPFWTSSFPSDPAKISIEVK